MDIVNDLSHLPTVRFDAVCYDDVTKRLDAWELLFRARAVLRVRGQVCLGGGRHVMLDYGRVLRRMRTYLLVETADGPVHVVLKLSSNSRKITYTVGPR
jgi:hypothetical protein